MFGCRRNPPSRASLISALTAFLPRATWGRSCLIATSLRNPIGPERTAL